jgi:glucosamine--fructose-6-phosphate aminotransferase (isomerizing)
MRIRQQIQEIPSALRLTLEKAHAEYEASARQMRWGDGPIYVCGTGSCAGLGLAAGYAFETFLGRPVVTAPVEVFQHYGISLFEPRSVLLMIASASEPPQALELAQVARQRGARLLVLTNAPEGALAKAADQVVLTRAQGDGDAPAVSVCLHAALNYLALTTARVLKRHEASWDSLEREIVELPTQIEWTLTQFPGVIRTMAAELIQSPRVRIVGGGFYHFPAWRAARRLQILPGLPAEGLEASEFLSLQTGLTRHADRVLFLSGSRSKLRKLVHRSAAQAQVDGARVLSVSDGNDRELAEQSDLCLRVPALMEPAGSMLCLALMEWLADEAAEKPQVEPLRPPNPPPG